MSELLNKETEFVEEIETDDDENLVICNACTNEIPEGKAANHDGMITLCEACHQALGDPEDGNEIIDDDITIEDILCPKCGGEIRSRDCIAFCDEGYFDEYDDDPINFAPETYTKCRECFGTGTVRWCTGCGWQWRGENLWKKFTKGDGR